MLPVVWIETALQDMAAITDYIADRNPSAATKLNARLQEDAELLGELPALFRRGPIPGTRQFVSHPQLHPDLPRDHTCRGNPECRSLTATIPLKLTGFMTPLLPPMSN